MTTRIDPVRLRRLWPRVRSTTEAAAELGVSRGAIHKAVTRFGLPPKPRGRPRVDCAARIAAREGCGCAVCRRLVREKRRRQRVEHRVRAGKLPRTPTGFTRVRCQACGLLLVGRWCGCGWSTAA